MDVAPPDSNRPALRWCFTWNNPPDNYAELLELVFNDRDLNVRYLVAQPEIGAEGTHHLQGYLHLHKPARFKRVKRLMPDDGIHLGAAKKPAIACIRYCTKTDTATGKPTAFGLEPVESGHRTDLDELQVLLDSGEPMLQIARASFSNFIRYTRGIYAYSSLIGSKPRDFKTHVSVYYGDSGTGKTRMAQELGGSNAYWLSASSSQHVCWFDGYDSQTVVVIDDFYGWIRWSQLLQLLDRYPCRVRTQAGSVNFNPKRIIITSNRHPGQWYTHSYYEEAALRRRIDYLTEFTSTSLGVLRHSIGSELETGHSCTTPWTSLRTPPVLAFTGYNLRAKK